MRPSQNNERPSDDHIELIVAKTPAFTSAQQASRSTHWNERQTLATASDATRSLANPASNRPNPSMSLTHDGKHYAVLMRRSGTSKAVKIIVQGEPKGTVEEALECMLERTEMVMHDMVVRYGRPDNDGCTVM